VISIGVHINLMKHFPPQQHYITTVHTLYHNCVKLGTSEISVSVTLSTNILTLVALSLL